MEKTGGPPVASFAVPGPPRPVRGIRERTFDYACRLVRLARQLDRQKGTDRILAAQLLRSGTSIGANLEEARAGLTKPDFRAKCAIALKEARETHYWLRLLAACEVVPPDSLQDLLNEGHEIVAILTAIVRKSGASKERARPPDPT